MNCSRSDFCLEYGAMLVEEYQFASMYGDQDFINLLNFKHPEKVMFNYNIWKNNKDDNIHKSKSLKR